MPTPFSLPGLGIGTDIIHIPRIERALRRYPAQFTRKILTPLERRAWRHRLESYNDSMHAQSFTQAQTHTNVQGKRTADGREEEYSSGEGSRSRKAQFLAGRWAAKEAIMKAWGGSGYGGKIFMGDIVILPWDFCWDSLSAPGQSSGPPVAVVLPGGGWIEKGDSEEMWELWRKRWEEAVEVKVSISHDLEAGIASAFAMVSNPDGGADGSTSVGKATPVTRVCDVGGLGGGKKRISKDAIVKCWVKKNGRREYGTSARTSKLTSELQQRGFTDSSVSLPSAAPPRATSLSASRRRRRTPPKAPSTKAWSQALSLLPPSLRAFQQARPSTQPSKTAVIRPSIRFSNLNINRLSPIQQQRAQEKLRTKMSTNSLVRKTKIPVEGYTTGLPPQNLHHYEIAPEEYEWQKHQRLRREKMYWSWLHAKSPAVFEEAKRMLVEGASKAEIKDLLRRMRDQRLSGKKSGHEKDLFIGKKSVTRLLKSLGLDDGEIGGRDDLKSEGVGEVMIEEEITKTEEEDWIDMDEMDELLKNYSKSLSTRVDNLILEEGDETTLSSSSENESVSKIDKDELDAMVQSALENLEANQSPPEISESKSWVRRPAFLTGEATVAEEETQKEISQADQDRRMKEVFGAFESLREFLKEGGEENHSRESPRS